MLASRRQEAEALGVSPDLDLRMFCVALCVNPIPVKTTRGSKPSVLRYDRSYLSAATGKWGSCLPNADAFWLPGAYSGKR